MPTPEEVEDRVADLLEIHEDLLFEVEEPLERVELEEEGNVVFQYHHVARPSLYMCVWGKSGQNHIAFDYQYDLVTEVENQLSEAQVEKWADPVDDVDDVSQSTYAAANILGAIDSETEADIVYQLNERLLQRDIWSSVETKFDIDFAQFRLINRVFPYNTDFSPKEYDEAMSTVMNTGVRARRFLRYTLNMDQGEEGVEIPQVVEQGDTPS